MIYKISQKVLDDETKKNIFAGFAKASIKETGIDGLAEPPLSFEIRKEDVFIGAIVVQMFWGQLHIKYLFIEEQFRGQGIAIQLMEHAFEYGKSRGCTFAFVEQ